MFRRRRPLLRGAAVGGAAYYAGKRRAGNEAGEPGAEDNAPADDGSLTDDQITQLERLSKLKDEGALTEDEFEAQKQKILGP
jgi:putative oligomerization/nucleic acid binding protein